ncbi:ABC transporter ATP-binding protein [Trueperella sp. LYQ143]|uniref:ABC transporter ATP-binding protein n=1 Tax=unclassified Trueperella TaxID=2630174 RepID=UPI003983C870
MSTTAINLCNFTQGYGKHTIFNELSLQIPSGGVIGLLGPNGAGKTTLLKSITGILKPKAGTVTIMGRAMSNAHERRLALQDLSFLPQDFSADPALTVRQFVEYNLWMRTFPKKQIADAAAHAIERVDLTKDANKKIRALSGGMRQRTGIAAAIAGTPQLIILDEPTAGLDPEQRAHFRQLLSQLNSTILLSTHLVEDVESAAQHLVVLSEGRVVHNGSSEVLVQDGDRSVRGLEQRYIELLRA